MERRRRATATAAGWLGAALAVAVACGPAPDPRSGPAPPVISLDPGLVPRLTPERVAGIVLDRIHDGEAAVGRVVVPARIVRMTVTTSRAVGRVEPAAGGGGQDPDVVVWVVRAVGTFTNRRTPPGAEPAVAGSGYYVVSDADESIVTFGFP